MGIAALAPIILNLLGGPVYETGSTPLRIIMFFTALFVTQNILTQAVASIRRTRLFLFSSAFALTSNVVLSIIFIPHLHISVFQLPVRWYEVKYSRTSLKRLFHDIILHGWGILLLFKRLRNYSV